MFCTARWEVLPCKLQTLSWEPAQRPARDQGRFFHLLAVPTGGGVSRLIFPTEEGRTGSLFLHPLPPAKSHRRVHNRTHRALRKAPKSLEHRAAPWKTEKSCYKPAKHMGKHTRAWVSAHPGTKPPNLTPFPRRTLPFSSSEAASPHSWHKETVSL